MCIWCALILCLLLKYLAYFFKLKFCEWVSIFLKRLTLINRKRNWNRAYLCGVHGAPDADAVVDTEADACLLLLISNHLRHEQFEPAVRAEGASLHRPDRLASLPGCREGLGAPRYRRDWRPKLGEKLRAGSAVRSGSTQRERWEPSKNLFGFLFPTQLWRMTNFPKIFLSFVSLQVNSSPRKSHKFVRKIF